MSRSIARLEAQNSHFQAQYSLISSELNELNNQLRNSRQTQSNEASFEVDESPKDPVCNKSQVTPAASRGSLWSKLKPPKVYRPDVPSATSEC